jgi:hypothetical protein
MARRCERRQTAYILAVPKLEHETTTAWQVAIESLLVAADVHDAKIEIGRRALKGGRENDWANLLFDALSCKDGKQGLDGLGQTCPSTRKVGRRPSGY